MSPDVLEISSRPFLFVPLRRRHRITIHDKNRVFDRLLDNLGPPYSLFCLTGGPHAKSATEPDPRKTRPTQEEKQSGVPRLCAIAIVILPYSHLIQPLFNSLYIRGKRTMAYTEDIPLLASRPPNFFNDRLF
jgi:hypothetical protein